MQTFLEANDEEWMLETARWQAETSAQKQPPVQGAMNWLKNLTHATQSLVYGSGSDDTQEDAEYVKVRDEYQILRLRSSTPRWLQARSYGHAWGFRVWGCDFFEGSYTRNRKPVAKYPVPSCWSWPELTTSPPLRQVRDYVNKIEGHLAEAHRQAGRLVRKELELSQALAEFGLAAEQLGKLDEAGSTRMAFDLLNVKADQIAALSRQRCEQLAADFEMPLKEFARTIKSVQAAMADRALALSTLSHVCVGGWGDQGGACMARGPGFGGVGVGGL